MDVPFACDKTCELERNKKEVAVSAAVEVKHFTEVIDAAQFPALVAKDICIMSNKHIEAAARELAKLSNQVKRVDLLEVLHFKHATTSLVKVPCSTELSGFEQQVQRSR
jgi:hypothetical protein